MTARAEALLVGIDSAPAQAAPLIAASRALPHRPEDVFAFLADLEQHWRLTDRYMRLIEVSADGRTGRIALRAPLGLRRIARTEVTTIAPPHRLGGVASVGGTTRARVEWRVVADGGGARVQLAATLEQASLSDRLLLALGGRSWLRRRFAHVLARLAAALDVPEPVRTAQPSDLREVCVRT